MWCFIRGVALAMSIQADNIDFAIQDIKNELEGIVSKSPFFTPLV